MVLAVTLNTVARGDLFVLRASNGDILVRPEDLQGLGLRVRNDLAIRVDGDAYVPLAAIAGLQYRVVTARLLLELEADPALLPSSTINLYQQRRANRVRSPGPTAFLNYSLQAGTLGGGSPTYTFTTEGGLRLGNYLLQTDGTTVRDSDGNYRMVRLMSRAVRDDFDSLQRLVIGDFFSPAGELGSSVNLGGISLAKQYGLDPYALRQPLSNLRARVAVPSDVEVLVDGQRVRVDHVPPGEFQLRDLYGYGGARSVQLLVRDAFGRVQTLDYSVYFSDQPLRAGLHDYSYGVGLLRRDYGTASDSYGAPAASGYHRYGLSDAVTVGVRAEGRSEMQNVGALGTFVLGSAGVLSTSLASSTARGIAGRAASLAYNYQRRSFSAGLAARRDSAGYATLTDPLTLFNRRSEASVYGSYYVNGIGTVSLNYSMLTVRPAVPLPDGFSLTALPASRVSSLQYSAPLVPGLANLSVTFSHIRNAAGAHNELNANVIAYFERNQSYQAGIRRNGDSQLASARLTRTPSVGEGYGYDIAVDEGHDAQGSDSLQLRLSSQLNTQHAVFRAEAERSRTAGVTSDGYRTSVAGSIVWIEGQVRAGRPVADSFALVRTGGVAGVPVMLNGQRMGQTDAEGQLLVPSVASFYDNEIAVDQNAIPIDYGVDRVSQRVAPLYRSGIVVDFGVTKVRAVSGRLVQQVNGRLQPVELQEVAVRVAGKDVHALVGRGGVLYLENLGTGRYLGRVTSGNACTFELVVPASADSFLELGDVNCR